MANIIDLVTQSPIQSALGFLSKKKKKKAKKKAKRKAKRERQRIADELQAQGVAPAQSRQIASQRVASSSGSAPSMGANVNNMNPDGTEKNFLMKDYLGIGIPTIPLAGGLVLVAKQMGLFGKTKRTYRKRSRKRRR